VAEPKPKRLIHPADRESFRRRFCQAAESQYLGPLDASVRDCSGLARFAYRMAGPPSPLFETASGPRHFADVQNLKQYNCLPVSRDVRDAQPADLMIFLQLFAEQPFHAMVFLGPSSIETAAGPFAVYHTGPIGKTPGEVRRPALADLMIHPDPRWRPSAANASFLGVHRWRILA
jgi:uncharacterized protein YfaT (DUF1175 family)